MLTHTLASALVVTLVTAVYDFSMLLNADRYPPTEIGSAPSRAPVRPRHVPHARKACGFVADRANTPFPHTNPRAHVLPLQSASMTTISILLVDDQPFVGLALRRLLATETD